MAATTPLVRIGIYGSQTMSSSRARGCGLWPGGYAGAVEAAGGTPVTLRELTRGVSPGDIRDGVAGVVFVAGRAVGERQSGDEERFCKWCQEHRFPLLGVD